MFRQLICAFCLFTAAFGQDLRVVPLSIRQLEMDPPKVLRQNDTPAPKPVATAPRKSHKGRWIAVAVVAGAAVATLLVVDRRLANEGHGIFR